MKAELVNHPEKGVCILISDLQSIELQTMIGNLGYTSRIPSFDLIFNDVHAIANQIRQGRKIGAIKEVRYQTGWGLKEAKEYIDKFYPTGGSLPNSSYQLESFADRFIEHHTPKEEFITDNDVQII